MASTDGMTQLSMEEVTREADSRMEGAQAESGVQVTLHPTYYAQFEPGHPERCELSLIISH